MAVKEIICITCPKGCHMQVDTETLEVKGNSCARGAEYGKNELTHPVRTLTSTVRLTGAALCRVPVKTSAPVPKEKVMDVMHLLDTVQLHAPVAVGDVVLANVLGSGADVVVTRTLQKV